MYTCCGRPVVGVRVYTCHGGPVEVGKFLKVGSLLPTCGSQGLKLSNQVSEANVFTHRTICAAAFIPALSITLTLTLLLHIFSFLVYLVLYYRPE